MFSIPNALRRLNKTLSVSCSRYSHLQRRPKSTVNGSIIRQLPPVFLRMSSKECYDSNTHQRNDVVIDGKTGKPVKLSSIDSQQSIKSIAGNPDTGSYIVEFGDGFKSEFSPDWVKLQVDRIKSQPSLDDDISPVLPRIPWSNITEKDFRSTSGENRMSVTFDDLILSPDYNRHVEDALQILYQYGILLIPSTPTDDGGCGVSAISSALSGAAIKSSNETSPLEHYRYCHQNDIRPSPFLEHATEGPERTLFGSIWSTHANDMASGTSSADSAYGHDALPLHTDMTYFRDPPGLQIFTMVNPADNGGESTYGDGLAVAERLRKNHPKEFDVLCRTVRRYRSIDTATGWHLEGSGPVIEAIDRSGSVDSDHWGAVVAIKHNDLDRLPDLPPLDAIEGDTVDEYYSELRDAHNVLDKLLGSDEFRLVIALKPGDTVVLANQVRLRFSLLLPHISLCLLRCNNSVLCPNSDAFMDVKVSPSANLQDQSWDVT
jgi:hypothetical protein